MQSRNEIKNSVEWFSGLMETKLMKNAHKDGWQECSLLWLVTKLNEEVGELAQIIASEVHSPDGTYVAVGDANTNPVLRAALYEAADVANVALMIGDLLARGKGQGGND